MDLVSRLRDVPKEFRLANATHTAEEVGVEIAEKIKTRKNLPRTYAVEEGYWNFFEGEYDFFEQHLQALLCGLVFRQVKKRSEDGDELRSLSS